MDTHLARQLPNDIIIRVIREATEADTMDYWIALAEAGRLTRPHHLSHDDRCDEPGRTAPAGEGVSPRSVVEEIKDDVDYIGAEAFWIDRLIHIRPGVKWERLPDAKEEEWWKITGELAFWDNVPFWDWRDEYCEEQKKRSSE